MKCFLVGVWCFLVLAGPVQAGTSSGSGFVVRADGYVVTCEHVVRDARKITARIDGRVQEMQLVRSDAKRDLALLKSKPERPLPVVFSLATQVRPGMESYALGYPIPSMLGELLKITRGIISGFLTKGGQRLLHTDTSFSPGNSGGALVDNRGRLLGVTSARIVGHAATGTGIAVPTDDVRDLLRENKVELPPDGLMPERMDAETLYEKLAAGTALITATVPDEK